MATAVTFHFSTAAATLYVDCHNSNPLPPYTNWAAAASTIQEAVDAAAAGDQILVNDGVYRTGGRVVSGSLQNRVVISKAVTVRSANGPATTIIEGYQVPGSTNGDGAVRCVYLSTNATLIGFTLTNGATRMGGSSSSENRGGGAYCLSKTGVLSNCVIAGNAAATVGGGVYAGTVCHSTLVSNCASNGGGAYSVVLENCTLGYNHARESGGGGHSCVANGCAFLNNTASLSGGGACKGSLTNCTLTGNSSPAGGGVQGATLANCIVYHNSAVVGPNHKDATLTYSCTTPLPEGGVGNLALEPLLADTVRLAAASPCRGAGRAPTYGTDLDGEAWANPPSMGCDEFSAATAKGPLAVSIRTDWTKVTAGWDLGFRASIDGAASGNSWDFGDGILESNRPCASHAWSTNGSYPVVFRAYNGDNPGGISATALIHVVSQPVHYVALDSRTPLAPFGSWATAASNIQVAIAAATVPGALVLVSNGIYTAGGTAVFGAMTNRVAVTLPLALRSVNGPDVTVIQGTPASGDSAVRCVYLTNRACLIGFTLSNGAAHITGDNEAERSGGGAWCAAPSCFLSNCTIAGNRVYGYGAGVYGGTLKDCRLNANMAYSSGPGSGLFFGGGAYGSALSRCSLTGNVASSFGGGACKCVLEDCVLVGNRSDFSGGGAYDCCLTNCALNDNYAQYGGGAYYGVLSRCGLTNNTVSGIDVGSGGAACSNVLDRCALIGNQAYRLGGGAYGSTLNGCLLSGNRSTNGGGAHTCILSNCTITWNSAAHGGGAATSLLSHCTLLGNRAATNGGGIFGGTLDNCLAISNSASQGGGSYAGGLRNCLVQGNSASLDGGGAYDGMLTNCTVVGNSAESHGGGTHGSVLYNCVVYYNAARSAPNHGGAAVYYSCCSPLPEYGMRNIDKEPLLADWYHLASGSPCRGAGSATYASGEDRDAEPWANPPSMGCDELNGCSGPLAASIFALNTAVAAGFPVDLIADIAGAASANSWDFGDGTILNNRPCATHTWTTPGDYQVQLRVYNDANPGGVSIVTAIQVAPRPVHHVAAASAAPTAPFSSWSTAARTIQDAVDAATVPGALVLVSNGVYSVGGKAVYGTMTNRVAVTKPLVVRSVNGPAVTLIAGRQAPGTTNGDGAIRCVYLTNGAALAGFTLCDGATRAAGDTEKNRCGGGIWSAGPAATVSNCALVGNAADYHGGGAFNAALASCILVSNWCNGHGGGAYVSTLSKCILSTNRAWNAGGGAYDSTLNDCLLTNNFAFQGGGASASRLTHCTVTGNSAKQHAGGVDAGVLQNCIVYHNRALYDHNYSEYPMFSYCCTTPLPGSGIGNLGSEPCFANREAGNLRLAIASPCVNSGTNVGASASTDLDGRPRRVGERVDMGAYEFQGTEFGEFIPWLAGFGLPTDGSADFVDTDHDGSNNWQEWRARTSPVSAQSALKLHPPTALSDAPGLAVSWQSVSGVAYYLQRSTNLAARPAFLTLSSNLAGEAGITTFADTNASGSYPFFYRVGIQ